MKPFTTPLANGLSAHVREMQPGDAGLVEQGFGGLSERSRRLRFQGGIAQLSEAQINEAVRNDDRDHFAIGALVESGSAHTPAALGRFIRLKDQAEVAELAITVLDAYQRLGLGTLLVGVLAKVASDCGMRSFLAAIEPQNIGMRRILFALGAQIMAEGEGHASLPLFRDPRHYPPSAIAARIRDAYDLTVLERSGPPPD